MDLIEFALYGNIGGWDEDKKQKKPHGKKESKEVSLKDVEKGLKMLGQMLK